jgi:hypothetical protein
MLVYAPFTLCFVYTSWHFYAFSRTNLLTRCHGANSLFLLFLCFRKVTQEIFSELEKTKSEVPNYLTRRRSPKESRRRTRGQPHPMVARPRPGPRHQGVTLVHPLTSLPPIYSPQWENPKGPNSFPESYCKPPLSSTRDQEGPEALPGTLPERGITTRGLLHHHTCLRNDVWVVYLGLRVHCSS